MEATQSDRLKRLAPRWALDVADVATRGVALATAADRPFPDFLIVGAKRGGTTSLFNYLAQHPGILGMYPQVRGKKSTDYYFAGKGQTSRWYRSHFHAETYRKIMARRLGYRPLSFEASPYYIWDPRIAPEVARSAPETRAILLLRDPAKRAWSHYQERVQNGVEPLSFADALGAEEQRLEGELSRMLADRNYHSTAWDWYSYRSRGEYLGQILNWEANFPREQLLTLTSEQLYQDTQATIDKVCTFLSIPSFTLPITRAYNATWRTKESAPAAETESLMNHYRPHNEALESHLGHSLPWGQQRGVSG